MTPKDSDETKIAVINNNIQFIMKDIVEIKLALRDQYSTRESLIQVARETEGRLLKLESASYFWRWMVPIISTIGGSTVTFLIISYLQNLK